MAVTHGVYGATDATGWTTISLPVGNKRVYVSNSGSSGNDGLTDTTPKQTMAQGVALLNAGDHLLLKRGDQFNDEKIFLPSSNNPDEPTVVSYYGASGPRPVLALVNNTVDSHFWGTGDSHLCSAIIGLDFHCQRRDPNHVNYVDGSFDFAAISLTAGSDFILIEDCIVRFYRSGFYLGGVDGECLALRIRRNIIVDQYWVGGGTVCSGLAGGAQNICLIEENLFDHNGWNEDVAGADPSIFYRSQYMFGINNENTHLNGPVICRGNIYARDSSGPQMRPGGDLTDNAMISCEYAMGFFQPHDRVNTQTYNVVIEGKGQALGLAIDGTESGLPAGSYDYDTGTTEINHNIVCHTALETSGSTGVLARTCTGAILDSNIVWDWTGNPPARYLVHDEGGTDITLTNNVEMMKDIDTDGTIYSYPGHTPVTTGITYSDPDRTVGSYATLIGVGSTTADFLDAVRARAIGVWTPNITANAFNNYIRVGFDEEEYPAAEGVTSIGGRPLRAMRFK